MERNQPASGCGSAACQPVEPANESRNGGTETDCPGRTAVADPSSGPDVRPDTLTGCAARATYFNSLLKTEFQFDSGSNSGLLTPENKRYLSWHTRGSGYRLLPIPAQP